MLPDVLSMHYRKYCRVPTAFYVLRHYQTQKFQRCMLDIMPKLSLKALPRCANTRNSRFLHFCPKKMDLWSKIFNFKQLCFTLKKVLKSSHLVKSKKVASMKSTENAAVIGPFFYGAVSKNYFRWPLRKLFVPVCAKGSVKLRLDWSNVSNAKTDWDICHN